MAMNGGTRADRIAQAEAAILSLKSGYKEQLALDVSQVVDLWGQIRSDGPNRDVVEALFSLAHNVKGQAGSFGYDLVTDIGASLCNLLRGDEINPHQLKAVGHHVQVLKSVVDRDVTGDGGAAGAKIMAKLKEVSDPS